MRSLAAGPRLDAKSPSGAAEGVKSCARSESEAGGEAVSGFDAGGSATSGVRSGAVVTSGAGAAVEWVAGAGKDSAGTAARSAYVVMSRAGAGIATRSHCCGGSEKLLLASPRGHCAGP